MEIILTELGKKLMGQWVTVLFLPGVLFVGGVVAARELGHRDAVNARVLARHVEDLGRHLVAHPAAAWLAVVLVVLLAVLVAMAAQTAGAAVFRMWVTPWPAIVQRAATPLINLRIRRWNRANDALTAVYPTSQGVLPPQRRRLVEELTAVRNARGLYPPRSATWMADRLTAADERIWSWWGLDVTFTWPRLWLLLPAECQIVVQTERARLTRATLIGGWAVLYAGLAVWWWPAAVIFFALIICSWRQARSATDAFAHVTEAVYDVHARLLAEALGLAPPAGPLPQAVGHQVTREVRKHA